MKKRVLVVDDDPDIRETVRLVLEDEGYAVEEAGDGAAALALLRAAPSRPDVILLDLMMPIMNGWQFCQYRATSAALQRVPVVLITARHGVAPPAGVSEVLLKPFDLDALSAVITRALTTGG